MQRRTNKRTQQIVAVNARTAINTAINDDSRRDNAIDEADDSSEIDDIDPDDQRWDAFIADEDERNPQPEFGDFWPAD